ncbi:ComEC/Rec2 family competence protein [Flavobacterium crassostreae]|uniref:Competence protein ComEC n=1 Tax=Flavobacterium crassostreae TaxID=1763534 RepID=A0A1B9DZS4_9FLAO|nr:ComEC/Rec2 family competence protein [Flavobacterium crassostreae]OCB75203.1 competence protein ComEC [Flavobacterium crassostreae]
MKVLQYPLTPITVFFILGILLANMANINPNTIYHWFGMAITLLVAACLISIKRAINPLYFLSSVCLLALALGTIAQLSHSSNSQKHHYNHHPTAFSQTQEIKLLVREKLKNTPYHDRYVALLTQINGRNATGKIIVQVTKDKKVPGLIPGSSLKLQGRLQRHKKTLHPNQFDYGKYLDSKQIHAQLYTNYANIAIGTEYQKDLWYYSALLRNKIVQNLKESNFNQTELNVATALILGQKQEITPEILQDYRYAGATHILSVSGLHVGFIVVLLNFVLKPFGNNPKGRLIKLLCTLFCLFFFALLTGLLPSVVRSVTMFSFVAIGLFINRKNAIYYTLVVSLLLILVCKPSFLFEVGFQLSYLALFFIVWLQPTLSKIVTPKQKITRYVWDLFTVTLAAQLGTLPLSIYYFHQFPGLFFVTNLVVIPLVSLIMILGISVMSLAAIGYVPFILSKPLEYGIYGLNYLISTIASLEQFILKDIPLNLELMLGMYLGIVTLVIWIKNYKYKQLILVLLAIIGVQITYFKTQWQIQKQQEWIVYNINRSTLISSRKGTKISLYANQKTIAAKQKVLKPYQIAHFSSIQNIQKIPNFAYFNKHKIAIIDSSGVYIQNSQPDVLLLTASPKINLERVLQLLQPKVIVADASNYKSLQNQWKETCKKQKIPFHATAEKGFFILK